MVSPILNSSSFLDNAVHLQGQSQSTDTTETTIVLANENYPTKYIPNAATIPDWLEISAESVTLSAGGSKAISILAKAATLEEGIARATIAFDVQDGGLHPECIGEDINVAYFSERRRSPKRATWDPFVRLDL